MKGRQEDEKKEEEECRGKKEGLVKEGGSGRTEWKRWCGWWTEDGGKRRLEEGRVNSEVEKNSQKKGKIRWKRWRRKKQEEEGEQEEEVETDIEGWEEERQAVGINKGK